MKAVIPLAGIGKRLRPLTHTCPKALVPVAGKPILGHIVDSLIDAGVTELVPIIGYMGGQIRDYFLEDYDMPVNFVIQEDQKGIAHAVSLTREYADNSELIIILGDTIIDADFSKIPEAGDYVLGVREVDDPHRFGICEVSGGIITGIEEKPENPKSNLAVVGIYYFKDSSLLYRSCEHVIENDIRTKDEYQLTDALSNMIENDVKFVPYKIDNWFDCGKVETLLETNSTLLKGNKSGYAGKDSLIIDPCFIGSGSSIKDSIIGPDVTVAKGCTIKNSIIRNSIISENCIVSGANLADSVLGRGAEVRGKSGRLNISDDSQVDSD
ncbi:MAG: NTP transferase domain-containing protein [Candidatus Krumholzibacteriota bacterium]|nr:NTP transferase domain-containing protein [Candidatus Krumholzibacteriota bacterium]